MIEICTVGGYSEVGKNMTAVKYKDEVVIFDMGLDMDKYVRYKGDEDVDNLSKKEMVGIGAIPDDKCIKDWRKNVVAIVPSHGHLDHIGAIPYMEGAYDCPIICSNYTAQILYRIVQDKQLSLKNEIFMMGNNAKHKLSRNLTLEFIYMTHSIPDTVMVALHTPEGSVVYGNDFKFDNYPVLGEKPNYDKLMKIGKDNVRCLILDSLYSWEARKTPSEMVARDMLKDVLLGVPNKDKAIIVTTFSSHIARLKSIIEFGHALNRKVVMLGRSMAKYTSAAEEIGLVEFSKQVEVAGYKSQAKKALSKIEKEGRGKYLIIATGHQGEPQAVLSRITDGTLKFDLHPDDHVIFSCSVIPSPQNVANREALEEKLKAKKVRIFKDIHVSGHASREDHRDLISMLKPKTIIPAHGDISKTSGLADLAKELGYELNKNVFLMHDGQRVSVE